MPLARRRFLLGGPSSVGERSQYKNQLIERFVEEYVDLNNLPREIIDNPGASGNLAPHRRAAEAYAYERATAIIDRTAERITDKSVGLLQVMALSAAIIAIVMQDQSGQGSVRLNTAAPVMPQWFLEVVLTVIALISMTLLSNLFIAWYGDSKTYRDRRLNIERALGLAAARARRLTIALVFSIGIIIVTGASVALIAYPDLAGKANEQLQPTMSLIESAMTYVAEQAR